VTAAAVEAAAAAHATPAGGLCKHMIAYFTMLLQYHSAGAPEPAGPMLWPRQHICLQTRLCSSWLYALSSSKGRHTTCCRTSLATTGCKHEAAALTRVDDGHVAPLMSSSCLLAQVCSHTAQHSTRAHDTKELGLQVTAAGSAGPSKSLAGYVLGSCISHLCMHMVWCCQRSMHAVMA
jgi:hypothetical protein